MRSAFQEINKYNLSIIGLGYLGYSNLVNFTSIGLKVNINDFGNKINRAKKINKSISPTQKIRNEFDSIYRNKLNFENIYKKSIKDIFLKKNSIIYLCNSEFLNSDKVNKSLIKEINYNKKNIKKNKPLFVIEFLNTPGKIYESFIENLKTFNLSISKDYNLLFAPRGDWNLENLYKSKYRPTWSSNKKAFEDFSKILSLFDQKTYLIDDLKNLEIISNLYNSLEHTNNILVNQLSLSYTDSNIHNLINDFNKLYSYNLSISGIGSMGLRLPSSSLNLLKGADNPDQLTILKEVIHTDFSLFKQITSKTIFNKKMKIAILGLGHYDNKSYEGISPSLELYRDLKNKVKDVKLHDSNVDFKDYEELNDIKTFNFAREISSFDIIIITTFDNDYASISWDQLNKILKCKIVFDTCGVWSKFKWKLSKIKYYLIK